MEKTKYYSPTLACVLNSHTPCTAECRFDKAPHRLEQFLHCSLCGYVKMFESDQDGNERWEPIDGLLEERLNDCR